MKHKHRQASTKEKSKICFIWATVFFCAIVNTYHDLSMISPKLYMNLCTDNQCLCLWAPPVVQMLDECCVWSEDVLLRVDIYNRLARDFVFILQSNLDQKQ